MKILLGNKRCIWCKKVKPYSEFYDFRENHDRKSSACKDCHRIYTFKYRMEHREQNRKMQREYIHTPKGKEITKKQILKYRLLNPLAVKAVKKLNKAVKSGKIIRQPCIVCGEKAQAHHPDYNKPLDVIWLCPFHHKNLHMGRISV